MPGIEKYCREKYGDRWAAYERDAPWQLFPGIYQRAGVDAERADCHGHRNSTDQKIPTFLVGYQTASWWSRAEGTG